MVEVLTNRFTNRSYHFIGIGGIGVSAVARVLHQRGAQVQGSDVRESQLTLAMRSLGAKVYIGHDPSYVQNVDVVVYSTAVPKDNIELVEAKRLGIPCLHRSEALGLCLTGVETVGVTGTHGKGTVSAMITHGLIVAERDPTFIIGGLLNQYGVNARIGKLPEHLHGDQKTSGDPSELNECVGVAEVDESDGSHLNLQPHHVIVNNLEVDHLNYYDGLDSIIDTMAQFIEQNTHLKTLSLNWGDTGVRKLGARLSVPFLKYGTDVNLDELSSYESTPTSINTLSFSARSIQDQGLCVSFSAYRGTQELGEVTLPIPGGYNAANAVGALCVMMDGLGLSFEQVQRALNTYEGLENRFTVRRAGGVTIVKDYLSHPTGMKRVLESAQRFDRHNIWCVFKPYRFTLMRYHGSDYAEAFKGADDIVITTMYAANEPSISGINTPWFVDQLREAGNRVHHIPDQEKITTFLDEHVASKDLVFFFGGDDFFRMADAWADQLDQRD